MPEIDPVILQLRADVMKYRADMEQTARRVTANLDRQEQSIISLEKQMLRSSTAMSGSLRSLGAAFASYLSIRELAALSDGFTRLQNNLRVAGLEGDALKQTQDELLAVSAQYGTSLESLTGLYAKVAVSSDALGASQAEILQISQAVAASLKILPQDAGAASGAIQQLGQALASPRVEAEEFGSILDALTPLTIELAKNIDGTGGTVAGLRAKLKDLKGDGISNLELFRAIIAALPALTEKADKATLTLAGGMTALGNALTVYFGEADKANGVSAAMGEAFKFIADNLDLLVPAMAATAIGLGVYQAGVAIATAQTNLFGAALTFVSRHPVVLALSALAAGVAYVALRSGEATAATEKFAKVQNEAKTATDAAQVAIDKLASAHGKARVEALRQAQAERENVKQKLASAQASLLLAEAEASRARTRAKTIQSSAEYDASLADTSLRGGALASSDPTASDPAVMAARRASAQADANAKAAEQAVLSLMKKLGAVDKAIAAPESVASLTASDKKKAKGKSGPSAEELAARYEQELSRLRVEQLQAELQLATDAQDRADLQKQILDEERNARVAEINANKDLTQPQRDTELEKIYKLYSKPTTDANGELGVTGPGLYQQGVNRDLQIQREREAADIADADARNKQDMLRADLQLADTREEKLALEMRLLDLAYEQEKLELEAVKASRELLLGAKASADAQWQIADSRLQMLGQLKARDAASVQRDNEGPLAAYARNLGATSLGDQAEQIVVGQLQTVQNGITDALAGALGTKNSLIKSLIAMFVQQVIMRPIAEALAQSGGGGGNIFGSILSAGLSLFGRASGGYVAPGQAVRVNEHRGTGVELLRMGSQGGTVIPLGQASAAPRGGNTIVQQTFVLDNRYGITTPQLIDYVNSTAKAEAARAGTASYQQSMRDAPAAIRKQSRYGTS